jgi:hypothetical protein
MDYSNNQSWSFSRITDLSKRRELSSNLTEDTGTEINYTTSNHVSVTAVQNIYHPVKR